MEPLKPLDRWWPATFGEPEAAGAQDGFQYAYFKGVRRLLLRKGGTITTYDTGDHDIHGVAQDSVTRHPRFTSDRGEVDLEQLKAV